ncbi:MAG TPA: hypothetical protein PLE19_22305 [Planctomycetota bacterium]|nr:hypothetical protein [Planctomycetota bacterium]HRR82535.1 hypothetical protein [Planctomycetota bacterium]HRT96319.1 hypothetical protein [Planctomycetota bacterium]
MEHIAAIAHGVLGLLAFTLPGLACLLRVRRAGAAAWPLPVLLGAAFVVSSLLVAAFEGLCLALLPPAAARLACWAGLAGVALACWRSVRGDLAAVVRGLGRWERLALAALAAVALFWLGAMPLSPYPSQVTMDLGDPPVYYRAAANLVAGRGWAPDYFAADYPRGEVSYVRSHPVPALATAFLFHLVGANTQSLHVYGIVAGVLLLCLLSALVRLGAGGRDGPHALLLTVGLAVVPSHFILLGLGVVTAPGALALATAVGLALTAGGHRLARCGAVGLSLALMVLLRPDSAMMAVLLAAAWLAGQTVGGVRVPRTLRLGLAGALAAGGVLLWLGLPALLRAARPGWDSLGIYFLRYDAAAGRFVDTLGSWMEQSRRLCAANLTGESLFDTVGNAAIGGEVQAHPVAFAVHLASWFPFFARQAMGALTVAQYRLAWLDGAPAVACALALLALAARSRPGRLVAVAMLAYLLLMPAVNPGARVRHMLVVTPVALALALRTLWGLWHGRLERALARRWAVPALAIPLLALAFLDARSIIRVRTYGPNCAYAPILRHLEEMTRSDDVIATSYPQLVTCMTGRRSVGGTWLIEHLGLIVERFRPGFLVVDNVRDIPRDYDQLRAQGMAAPGYEMAVHDPAAQYVIFRAASPRPSRSAP